MTREAVIVDCLRTAVGKAGRGALRATRPDDLAAMVIQSLLERYPQVSKNEIDDVIVGCAMPEGEQGMNMARAVALRAGLPDTVPGRYHQSLLRFGLAIDRDGGRHGSFG